MNRNTLYRGAAVYAAMFLVFFALTYTELLPLKIANATPMLLVPLTVAIGFFYGEWAGFAGGMVMGILADAVAADTVCFNMIVLMLIGVTTGILVNHYMNKNIFSILMLSLAAAMLYFLFSWLIFFVAAGFAGKIQFFLYHSIPSAVYTALFILPAYLPGKYIK